MQKMQLKGLVKENINYHQVYFLSSKIWIGKLREQQLFYNERKNDREETKSGRGMLIVEPEGEGSWAVAG